MRILNNVKLIFTCVFTIVCTVLSYWLLPLSLDIISGTNVLYSLFIGILIVPISLGLFISGILGTFSLIISGIMNKTKIWWILGIIILLANLGAVVITILSKTTIELPFLS